MNRKDTILIAVVINAGLLAVLFATAIIYDSEKDEDTADLSTTIVEIKEAAPEPKVVAVKQNPAPGDEVDNALKYFSQPTRQPLANIPVPETIVAEQPIINASEVEEEEVTPVVKAPVTPQGDTVEVTVKKGDSLDKIARTNGTTVSAIKKANQLESEKLSIGQVLKIPVKKEKQAKAPPKATETKETASSDAVYYTMKAGDNPWKIAKQFGVTTEEIVSLNNLDEVKSRNLKAGDSIRVK